MSADRTTPSPWKVGAEHLGIRAASGNFANASRGTPESAYSQYDSFVLVDDVVEESTEGRAGQLRSPHRSRSERCARVPAARPPPGPLGSASPAHRASSFSARSALRRAVMSCAPWRRRRSGPCHRAPAKWSARSRCGDHPCEPGSSRSARCAHLRAAWRGSPPPRSCSSGGMSRRIGWPIISAAV